MHFQAHQVNQIFHFYGAVPGPIETSKCTYSNRYVRGDCIRSVAVAVQFILCYAILSLLHVLRNPYKLAVIYAGYYE